MISTITQQTMAAQLATMNYKKQQSAAWRALTKATNDRNALYPGGADGIDLKYAAGWYVDPNSTMIEINGNPYDCKNSVGQAGSCCYSSSDPRQTKCCACGKPYSCNAGGGCLGTCNWGQCVNNRLNANMNQPQIDSEKADLANRNVQINALQSAYNTIPTPNPPFPKVDIGCCQSIIYSNISATAIKFDPNASVQQCTIINGAQTAAASSAVQNALRAQAFRSQGALNSKPDAIKKIYNSLSAINITEPTKVSDKFTMKNFLGVFGR
jgi:hypothetical protein